MNRSYRILASALAFSMLFTACQATPTSPSETQSESASETSVDNPRRFSEGYTLASEGHKLLNVFDIDEAWGDSEYHFTVPMELRDASKVYNTLFDTASNKDIRYEIMQQDAPTIYQTYNIWFDTDADGVTIAAMVSSDVDHFIVENYMSAKAQGKEIKANEKSYVSIYVDDPAHDLLHALLTEANINVKELQIKHTIDEINLVYKEPFVDASADIIAAFEAQSGVQGTYYGDDVWFMQAGEGEGTYGALVTPHSLGTNITIVRNPEVLNLFSTFLPQDATLAYLNHSSDQWQFRFWTWTPVGEVGTQYEEIFDDRFVVGESGYDSGNVYKATGYYTDAEGQSWTFNINATGAQADTTKIEITFTRENA